MSARLLVVDDEPQIVRGLRVILSEAGYEVETADTKEAALDAVSIRPPDGILLDLVLPDGSGVDVCTEIRSWSELPIVVLSAVGDEREKVRALDAGADDFVTKPFGAEELLARLRAVLRRARDGGADPRIDLGGLTIDLAAREVIASDARVHLTPIEFDIVSMLARNLGRLVTHSQLLQAVWGPGYESETHYLRVHVAHIRAKLEPDPAEPRFLLTEPGVGYRLRERA